MRINMPSALEIGPIALTAREKLKGEEIKLKVFWKTVRFWTNEDIVDFQTNAHGIIEKLQTEQYWDKQGIVKNHAFTCEDFAIRILCEYAAPRGLPIKLRTGVRTYRNMERYTPEEHDRYLSHMYGFSEMVMLTYGARDMQRIEENTQRVAVAEDLLPGDILAQALDNSSDIAHHIQIVTGLDEGVISIKQGNTSGASFRPVTTIKRIIGFDMADPQNSGYAGMPIETGYHTKTSSAWKYTNITRNSESNDFLKFFEFYRWDFMEFNR